MDAEALLGLLPPSVHEGVEGALRRFTTEQRLVIERVITTKRNLLLEATAGSGKSTVLRTIAQVLAATMESSVIRVFAFNSSIAAELRGIMPQAVQTSTLHAYGRKLLEQHSPRALEMNRFKRINIIKALAKEQNLKGPGLVKHLSRLTELSLMHLKIKEAELRDLAEQDEMDLPAELALEPLIQAVHARALELYETRGMIDYSDMLYLPIKKGYGRGGIDVQLLDEAQDFSTLQHRVIRHYAGERGRVIFVGDSDQSIYGFSGADKQGLLRAEESFNAERLNLTVTFRCPRSHVALAQRYSSKIQAAAHAKDGEVLHVPENELAGMLRGGDLVISRTNAPIITLALQLTQQHKQVEVLGLNLSEEIGKLITRAFPVPFDEDDIEGRLMALHYVLTEQHYQQGLSRKALRKAASSDADMLSTVAALATTTCLRHGGYVTAEQVTALLGELNPSGHGQAIKLCTIHKSKGLEAERVAILRPHELDEGRGDEDEARSVAFVAYTRAKGTLILTGRVEEAALEESDVFSHPKAS